MADTPKDRRATAEQFATRLMQTAETGEKLFKPDEVLTVFMSVAVSYAMRHNPTAEVVELLRETADKLEKGEPPRTVN